jgi:hypothetical protein
LLSLPQVRFGGESGKTVHLEVDPDLVAVRVRRGRSLREGPVRSPEAALLDEMETTFRVGCMSGWTTARRRRSMALVTHT